MLRKKWKSEKKFFFRENEGKHEKCNISLPLVRITIVVVSNTLRVIHGVCNTIMLHLYIAYDVRFKWKFKRLMYVCGIYFLDYKKKYPVLHNLFIAISNFGKWQLNFWYK